MAFREKDGVLLIAHGTVENLDDLPAFLDRIRHGRPAPPELVKELRRRYEQIGRSPLLDITREQAKLLSDELALPVLVGMRLWTPSVEQTLIEAQGRGLERLCLLPLAPFSVQVYWEAAQRSRDQVREKQGTSELELVPVEPWGCDPHFIAAHVNLIKHALTTDVDALVLSAHSLPMRAIRAGDQYAIEVEACARAIEKELGRKCLLAYQSAGTEGDWLGPDLLSVLREVEASGARSVAVAPFGFLADHIETLYDLDVEARSFARTLGLEWQRIPALNTSRRFIHTLRSLVEHALTK